MPKPIVTQTRLVPSAVVTMSLALDVQVGLGEFGPCGASFKSVIAHSLRHSIGTQPIRKGIRTSSAAVAKLHEAHDTSAKAEGESGTRANYVSVNSPNR